MRNLVKLVVVSALGGAISLGIYKGTIEDNHIGNIYEESATPVIRTAGSNARMMEDFTMAAEQTVNAVVHVKTAVESQMSTPSSPFEFFFGPGSFQSTPRIQMGSGSGVIVSTDGYIVTNNHVIDNAREIVITLNNEREFKASLIGKDPTTDIALLKIEASGLPYLTFSNSDDVKLGEWVLAVGNPFNLTSTVTAGIVSAKSRSIGIIDDRAAIEAFIQTDAAVNPGNSGGALVNTRGELIGINSAISTHTGSYEGYSFAVPSNIVKKVVEDLLEFGTVQRAFIGVNISDINQKLAEELDLETVNGVYVGGVTENGAAEEAGIQTGDIIIAVNEKKVSKSSELQELIGRKRPGDRVKITVNREGKEKELQLTLRNASGTTTAIKPGDVEFLSMLGANFRTLNSTEKARFGITHGLVITELKEGILYRQGIPENFIITHINRNPIKSKEDINESVEGLKKDDPVVIQGYTPQGRARYYAFGF